MRAKIESPEQALTFINGTNATFTIVSPLTQVRFTYKVRESKDGKVKFVSLLNGPSNEHNYVYMGLLKNNRIVFSKGSKVSPDATSAKALRWALRQLDAGRMSFEFWHEGRCCMCGRKLTVPSSIETGIGPICAERGMLK